MPLHAPVLRVFWQPGCTSCLRARELLSKHGIPFESLNVRENAEARGQLEALGVRTVPVVARGEEYVLAQDLDELARFVGITLQQPRLSPDELAGRLQALLAASETYLSLMPPERLHQRLPQRERSWLDLGFHVSMIVQALLSAGTGGKLAYEFYEMRAPPTWTSAAPAVEFCRATRVALSYWWSGARAQPDTPLDTYWGERPLADVLERTAWHVAQHCRQLEHLVREVAGVAAAPALPPQALAGLPLPEAVWDPEVVPA
jgi:glutaredoxin